MSKDPQGTAPHGKPPDTPERDEAARFAALVYSLTQETVSRTGHRPLALVHTYGCQQNAADSEKICGLLGQMGYGFTEAEAEADLILFNTCAVREHAEQRVFGNVGALSHLKKQKPSLLIGVCGCMAQEPGVQQRLRQSYPFVDLVFGTFALPRLPRLLFSALTEGGRVFDTEETPGGPAEGLPVRRTSRLHAWLPVMYGCNNFCSYCIVPYVRGRERSREPEAVLAEARALVADGCREITLLGQNVNSYGRGLTEPVNFAALLRALNDIPGEFRIRFMTSHPKDATPALFEAMAECEKVERHLHLPFQSGSDRMLTLMNRRYTKERYLSLIAQARGLMPGLSVSSDVIVGFPTETQSDFEETLDVVRTVRFDNLYTFLYSRRPGTPAARMKDDTPPETHARRFRQLLAAQEEISSRLMEGYVGKTLRVLCEGRGRNADAPFTGRADNNIAVEFTAPANPEGRFVPVRITGARRAALYGEAIPG